MSLNIHQKIITGTGVVIFLLLMYENLCHLLLEILHLLFESAEYILDLLIEYLLETGTHETQIIVFYILVAIIFCILYRLYRFLPNVYNKLIAHLHQYKTQTLAQWQALSLLGKMSWSIFYLSIMSGWLFLL